MVDLRRLSQLFAVVAMAAGAACDPAKVQGTNPALGRGGNGGSAGGAGGPGTGGGAGGSGTDGPAFNLDAAPGGTSPPVQADAAAGEAASCATETHQARQTPLDVLLLVDTSGSMRETAGNDTKWKLVRDALTAFWRDPKSAGLGLGLQFFPFKGADRSCMADADCDTVIEGTCGRTGVCAGAGPFSEARVCDPDDPASVCPTGSTCSVTGRCAGSGVNCAPVGMPCPGGGGMCLNRGTVCRNVGTGSCMAPDYQQPAVPVGALPASEAMLTQALQAKDPVGFTPTHPAVQGAFTYLRQHLMANPTHKAALVLFTDGLPLGCTGNSSFSVGQAIGAAFTGTPSITTYAIGVFSGAQAITAKGTLDGWARAGGTTESVVLSPTEMLTQRFLDTLNQIRGAALACDFSIPMPGGMAGGLDYGKVNVRATTAGGPKDLLYVGNATRCDPTSGGWHYDVDPAMGKPTRVLICPASCQALQKDSASRVDLVFGCATQVID